jgi:hypothetical protein
LISLGARAKIPGESWSGEKVVDIIQHLLFVDVGNQHLSNREGQLFPGANIKWYAR